MTPLLEPDRDQIEVFGYVIFRYATSGYFSLRAFPEDEEKPFRITPVRVLANNLKFLVDAAEDDARRAAQFPKPVVFCPPLATFNNEDRAREIDIVEAFALTVECDRDPVAACRKLEQLLGPATAIIRSGGIWTDPSGQSHDRIHLHWRLAKPARVKTETDETGNVRVDRTELIKLKHLRGIATRLVGGDPTNIPAVHPIRWPGSWHRKAMPRLCEIITADPDREIDLDAALRIFGVPPGKDWTAPEPHIAADDDLHNDRGRLDWSAAFGQIITGASYHPTLTPLAASFAAHAIPETPARKLLDALIANSKPSDPERERRRQTERSKLQSTVASAYGKFKVEQPPPHDGDGIPDDRAEAPSPPPPPPPLPFVDMSAWDSVAPPARQWLIVDHIPSRQVTLLSGVGGIGKSVLTLQLLASTVLRREWVGGLFPKPGAAIYLGAEDEQDEIHRRLAAILEHYDARFADLVAGGFRALAFAGKDAVLAEFDRNGRIKVTDLFRSLHAEAVKLQPSAIVIDTVSDVFLGDEIKRDQVRQFGSVMRRLAIDATAAVIIASHPSVSGEKSGTGLSGSTQWHNTVRARAYFHRPKSDDDDNDDDDRQTDDGRRELEFKKNQYGRLAKRVELRWSNGLWLPPAALGKAERQTEAERKAEDLFLRLLQRLDDQGRNVCAVKGVSFAPAIFADEPEAKRARISKKALTTAMSRLFEAKRIRVVTEGPPSKRRSRLAEVAPSTNGFQQPANNPPAASSSLATPSPLYPPPVVEGGRVLAGNAPPPSTTAPKRGTGGARVRDPVADVFTAWGGAFGFGSPVTVPFLIEVAEMDPDQWPDTGVRKIHSALLAVAEGEPGRIDSARLEQWLRENSGVEVGQYTLSDAGTGRDGLARWTLTLRVEPDQGSPSL
jgi:RecA-family ATPase